MKAPGEGLQSSSLALHWKWQLCKLAPLTVAFVVFLIHLLLPFLCRIMSHLLPPSTPYSFDYKTLLQNTETKFYSVSFFFHSLVFFIYKYDDDLNN